MLIFIIISLVAVVLAFLVQKMENRAGQIIFFIGGILVAYIVLLSLDFSGVVSKGRGEDILVENLPYLFLFVAMMMGMISKYFFDELGKKRFRFNFKRMIRPLFISPIVFMIVYQISEKSENIEVLHYLLAFQNGFFWQYIFEMYASKYEESKAIS